MVSAGRVGAAQQTGFLAVLRIREFRLLWFADLQSLLGDQLARVALSILVFEHTGSGFATASVYALTYLPALFGTVLLGQLADRLPRRALLVGGDLIRAALMVPMVLPATPLPVVALLLALVVLVGTPWKAAESAMVADIVDAERYSLGAGLRTATVQGTQLLGFASGGVLVSLIGARAAIGVDAATYVVSAMVIRAGIQWRPPAAAEEPASPATSGRRPSGLRAVFAIAELRWLLGLAWLAGLLILPEGLAAPYAHELNGGSAAIGLLLAAGPTGVLLGSILFTRFVNAQNRQLLTVPLAVAAGVPLIVCGLRPNLVIAVVLWGLSGACLAYQVQVVTEFVATVPARLRGRGIAVASSGVLAAQGLGILAGGAVTEVWSPSIIIAGAGLLASVLALWFGSRLQLGRR